MTAFKKIGEIAIVALWAAVAATFGKIMEPFLKWLLFLSFRGLVWLLPPGKVENAILDLFKEVHKTYGETYDVETYVGPNAKTPFGRGTRRTRALRDRVEPTFDNPGPES